MVTVMSACSWESESGAGLSCLYSGTTMAIGKTFAAVRSVCLASCRLSEVTLVIISTTYVMHRSVATAADATQQHLKRGNLASERSGRRV